MFGEKLIDRVKSVIRPKEGACGICHAVAEEVCALGGKVLAYERPEGIYAKILDDHNDLFGEGWGVVWSPAILAAEIDAGIIPEEFVEPLTKEGTNSKDDTELVSALYGYGRVLTPAAVALMAVKDLGGRTLIRRKGLGVVARFVGANGEEIGASPPAYCPVCAIVIGSARTPFLAKKIKEALKDVPNVGRVKYEREIENRYEVKGGSVRVTIAEGDQILAKRVLGCCIAYATVKAEIVAGLIPEENAKLFKAYCNMCPFKHCWLEKSMGATGNVLLQRLTECGTDIEVTAEGGIVAKIQGPDGQEIIGRGTLCSFSALTNMLLRADAVKMLRPSPSKEWGEDLGGDQMRKKRKKGKQAD
jgi:hypothetical protein